MPISVVHSEIQIHKGAEYGVGKLREALFENCLYKGIVHGDRYEDYPALPKAAADIKAAKEKIGYDADDGVGNAEPKSCFAVTLYDDLLLLVVEIVVIIVIVIYMNMMLSVGDFDAPKVYLHLVAVGRFNKDAIWSDVNLICVVFCFAFGFRAAMKIIEDGRIDSFRIDRYKSYNSGIGADILSGNATLESLEKYALERGEVVDVVESGRQEYLENVLNAVMFG